VQNERAIKDPVCPAKRAAVGFSLFAVVADSISRRQGRRASRENGPPLIKPRGGREQADFKKQVRDSEKGRVASCRFRHAKEATDGHTNSGNISATDDCFLLLGPGALTPVFGSTWAVHGRLTPMLENGVAVEGFKFGTVLAKGVSKSRDFQH